MVIAMTSYTAKEALEALTPILTDSRYFHQSDDFRISQSLRPQIEQAIMESDATLAPAPIERIRQIVARLILHFSNLETDQEQNICTDYIAMLQEYPEDLLCAAHQNVLRHHKGNSLPRIADFLTFMEPEMSRRKAVRCKLDILQQQTCQEENA